MKKILLIFVSPYYFLLKHALLYLKPACINEGDSLRKELKELGFFQAVVNHPAIIYGQPQTAYPTKHFTQIALWFFKTNITLGLFNNRIGRVTAQKAGVHSAFVNDMHRLLNGNNNDYIEYSFQKEQNTYKRIAIYSALTGDYDTLWEPIIYPHHNIKVDYILFTDNPALQSKQWQIRYLHDNCSPALLSRKVRMFPHRLLPEYDVCIYVDASMFIYGDIAQLSSVVSKETPFAITRHPARSTIREEAVAYADRMHIDRSIAEQQYNLYIEEGFKDDIPLTENGLFVAQNGHPRLVELLETWYEGYRTCLLPSDQIPLQPAMSKLEFTNYKLLNGSVWCNQFFMVMPHKSASARHRTKGRKHDILYS